MSLTQPAASDTHQEEQEILAQPSDGKIMPMSRISSDAILHKLQNRPSGPALPKVPCILGPFKVHHALCDWGAVGAHKTPISCTNISSERMK
jgi:hypothetical protein